MPKRQPVLKYQLPPIGMVTGSGGGGGSILGDTLTNADSVDGFHAYATAMPNSLCALDDDAAGPFDITGDADTVDGLHASAFTAPQFLTLATDSNLSNERVLTAGDGLDAADGGAGGLLTLAVDVTDLLGTGLSEDGSNNMTLPTPGTLTVSSSNAAAAPHTHAITSAGHAGVPAGASILACDGNADLSLHTLNLSANLVLGSDAGLTRHAASCLGPLSGDSLQSSNYTSGVSGWFIGDQYAEFANAWIRGELHAAVFVKDLISAHAGTLVVAKSGGKLAANYTVSGTMTIEDPPTGGWAFDTGDIIRIKAEYSSGVGDTWVTVTRTATTNQYTSTYQSGTNSITYPAGTGVVDYGVSGQGLVSLSADGAIGTGPNMSVITHAGAPWTAQTLRARVGDLYGSYDIGSNHYYGIGLGDYSSGNYLRYENNGSLLMKSGGGYVILDTTGLRMRATATRQVANSLCWNDSSEVEVGFINVAAGALGGAMFVRADEAISLDTDDAGLSLTATGIAMGVDCRIGGGLYVGGDSDPGVGEIHATSGMVIHDPGSPYYGYGINMDAATGTWARGFYFLNGTASLGGFGALGDATPAITYFWSGDAYNDTTARFYPSGGQVVIGQDAPAAECTGPSLTISQGGNDAAILCLQSSDVAHGMTDLNDTDTFGVLGKIDGNTGGLLIVGYDEGDVGLGLAGRAVTDDTAKSTSGLAYVTVYAQKKASATVGAVGSDANLFAIRNYATTRFLFDAEGSSHSDVEWTTFDAHDDVALLDALDQPFDAVKAEFGGWLVEQRDVLQRERVVNFYDDGPRAMVNFTRLAMLHTGAIRQLARRLERYEAELLRLGANPQALLN